jgi:RimJ/RimL family protein N-acetyltransferase
MTDSLIQSIFSGEHIHLGKVDPERDAAIEATWMNDPAYAEDRLPLPIRLVSESELKQKLQAEIKRADEFNTNVLFALRANLDDHLVGFLRIYSILWNQRSARMRVLYGGKGIMELYGQEIISLSLNYVFREMNLNRVTLIYPEYRQMEMDLLHAEGFAEEVRRRSAHYYHGKYWDLVHIGIIARDWRKAGEGDHGNL